MQLKSIILLIAFSSLAPLSARALPEQAPLYGTNGIAVAIENLPHGRLRSRLETLPAPAREKALKWLNRVNFPAEDVAFLRLDDTGGVFYSDPLPEQISQSELEADPLLEGISSADVFQLHSKPGSPHVVYINMLGYEISGTAWDQGTRYAQPFDLDGDPGAFSDSEKTAIVEIWHRVAEDYAPFDIDVTTEPPATFGPNTGHILVTKSVDAAGNTMPSSSSGGVAYLDVWGNSNFETYQPALVYYDNLGGNPDFIAEASAHELGHNLGLSHDGTSSSSYYSGHGPRSVKWGPIMGTAYRTDISQWSRGAYPDANNTQDDIAILIAHLDNRPDDHGNAIGIATALLVDGNGFIASSHPEFDPHNQRPENKGIINNSTDVDYFSFDAAAGALEISVEPAGVAFFRPDRGGVNLDIQLRLLDSAGNVLATANDLLDTDALISTDLAAGRYYLEIDGVGNATPIDGNPDYTLYSDYASMGHYYIHGSVPVGEPDLTAPTPDPMTWSTLPEATGRNSISMTASRASDDSGIVQYQFVCASHASLTSSWLSDSSYTVTGLQAGTTYTFQVRARDASGNETGLSPIAGDTTWSNTAPVSLVDSIHIDEDSPATVDVLANDTDADGDSLSIYNLTTPSHGDASLEGNQVVYIPESNFTGDDSFQYTATDGYGGFSAGTVMVHVMNVNDAPIAVEDLTEVLRGGTATVNVLANDTDPEGDPLSIIAATSGSKGTVTVNADHTLTYTTSGKGLGTDSFNYTVTDGTDRATALVTIDIVRELSISSDPGGEILSADISGKQLTLEWSSAAGTSYAILQCTNLSSGVWYAVATNIGGEETSTSYSIAIGTDHAAFYRIEVQ